VTLIFDCVQYLLYQFCWWCVLFFCFLPALTMSETSIHHSVSDTATFWNKCEWPLFSHQRFTFCLALYSFLQKMNGKTSILLFIYFFVKLSIMNW